MSQLVLTAEALAGSPVAGTTEYNGTIETFTPIGTQRGIVPAEQFFRFNANVAGQNINTVQSIFGVGVTLSASTIYEFEIMFGMAKTSGNTSHSVGLGFGGTATVNNIAYTAMVTFSTTSVGVVSTTGEYQQTYVQTTANTQVTGATTALVQRFMALIKGTVSVNAGGTFIPQYTLSAAPGSAYTTQAGAYIKIKPIGVSGANVSVGTWA